MRMAPRPKRPDKESHGPRPPLRHGGIWWANLPPPAGRRPVLLLTRDSVLGRMANVTIAPLTRTDRSLPTEVRLGTSDGVPTPCVVTLDNILTIPAGVLDRPIAQLSDEKMGLVYAAIRTALQME